VKGGTSPFETLSRAGSGSRRVRDSYNVGGLHMSFSCVKRCGAARGEVVLLTGGAAAASDVARAPVVWHGLPSGGHVAGGGCAADTRRVVDTWRVHTRRWSRGGDAPFGRAHIQR